MLLSKAKRISGWNRQGLCFRDYLRESLVGVGVPPSSPRDEAGAEDIVNVMESGERDEGEGGGSRGGIDIRVPG